MKERTSNAGPQKGAEEAQADEGMVQGRTAEWPYSQGKRRDSVQGPAAQELSVHTGEPQHAMVIPTECLWEFQERMTSVCATGVRDGIQSNCGGVSAHRA